jgi:hypothetical protein
MMAILTCTARSLVSTLEGIATPYSVNAKGGFLTPIRSRLDITICDFQSSISSVVSWNMKSGGEAIDVTSNGLIQSSCFDLVQRGEVAILHYLAAADEEDPLLDCHGRHNDGRSHAVGARALEVELRGRESRLVTQRERFI